MRQGTRDDGVGEAAPSGPPEALLIEECAFGALGGEKLIICRVVDNSGNDGALAFQPNRDRELGNSMEKIGGAIERIHNPRMGFVGPLQFAAFLTEETMAGPSTNYFLSHRRPSGGGGEPDKH